MILQVEERIAPMWGKRKGGEGAGGTIHPMGIFRKNAENQGESLISGKHRPIYRKWWFWVLATPLILFIALVIYRIPAVAEKERTEQVVAQIHAQKLTINDVNGEHLPPPPDPAQADATIEGIDANANGIRDDVELAIFKKYPNSAKIRAAELQYAKELQTMITLVFNSETWKAAAFQNSRGFACISQTSSRENLKEHLKVVDERVKETHDLVVNTKTRKNAEDSAYSFTTSFGLANKDFCDVTLDEHAS